MHQFISPPSIIIENLSFSFKQQILFDGLNLKLPAGKTTCILGSSGIGKSTLIRIIANLFSQDDQSIVIEGKVYSDNLIPIKNQISYIAQADLLLPWLTVLDNILLGFRLRNTDKKTLQIKRSLAHELLSQVGLINKANLFPQQLSGGMKQRVALVRTFIEDMPIVLMDEPFSSLDTLNRFNLQTLMCTLLAKKTKLIVTHDPLEALRVSDYIYLMHNNPATLTLFTALPSCAPRDPSDPEIVSLHATLLHHLLNLEGERV
jgi:putative hydroxymethylpyrimidine transport system ATP-binding protein